MQVGFVGLGNMGSALARRLMLSRPLRVYDLNPQAVSALADAGATPASSLAGLAEDCDVVLTCLPTSAEVRAVIFGGGRLAESLDSGAVIADMTTGDPVATREMAAELSGSGGPTLIDAPVSGGPQGADKGTIAVMVGAPDAVFQRCREIFDQISVNVFHTGGVGNGHTMKLVNNVISASNRAIAFEAVALGVKNGLDPETCIEVLQKGSGRSFTTDITFPNSILSGTLDQGFSLGLMHKDVSLATKLGQDSATPMLMAGVVRELYRAAMNEYGPDVDINTLIRRYEDAARVKIVPDKG